MCLFATLAVTAFTVTPASVEAASRAISLGLGSGYSDVSPKQIVRTSANIVYIVATSCDSYPCTSSSQTVRVWKGDSAGVPKTFTRLDSAHEPLNAGSVAIAIDGSDVIHIAWQDRNDTLNTRIMYSEFDTASGLWGAIETIEADVGAAEDAGQGDTFVALAVDANGKSHVAYLFHDGTRRRLAYKNRASGAWNTRVFVDNNSYGVNEKAWLPNIAFDSSGRRVFAWLTGAFNDNTNGVIRVRVMDTDDTFGTRADVSTATAKVGIDQSTSLLANGTLHVTWIAGGSPGTEYVRYAYAAESRNPAFTTNHPANADTHDPSLGPGTGGTIRIYGHGSETSNDDNLYFWEGPGGPGAWSARTPYASGNFDSSVSTRWSQYFHRFPLILDIVYWDDNYPNALIYGADQAPVINSVLYDPPTGSPPLTVNFQASATDPDSNPLTYTWSFGDGGTAPGQVVSHTYPANGSYNAQVTVSNGATRALSSPLPIVVGTAPNVSILAPIDQSTFRAGDTITYQGTATDDGPLTAANYSWRIVRLHGATVDSVAGPFNGVVSGSFTVPTSGPEIDAATTFQFVLTVTDGDGLQSTQSATIRPDTVNLSFDTTPSGLAVVIDDVSRTTPITGFAIVKNFQITASVISPQTLSGTSYDFTDWSDGQPQSHTITVPETTQSYIARFGTSAPSLSISDVSVVEGNAGTGTMTFSVTLSAASSTTVTVNYATADATATAGSDYSATAGTLTFDPGVTSQSIAVPVLGDSIYEGDETFVVALSAATNATIAVNHAVGTITNDDPMPSLSIGSATVTEGNSGSRTASFAVSLSAPSGVVTTVQYATANGTATAGTDYTAAAGTLTFAPGMTTQTIAVLVLGDTILEPDETFVVNLSAPANATVAVAQGTGTILNDDVAGALTIGNIAVTEGNSGVASAAFTVSLSAPSALTTTVNYATADGTAVGGVDYTAAAGTLTFSPGTTTQTILVPVLGDALYEADETFVVNLSAATNATIAVSQATGTILNDDLPPSFSAGNASVAEGNSGTRAATFTVTLSTASGLPATVRYATADGTALAGSDYQAASGTLTFPAGVTTQTVAVMVLGDSMYEPNETFVLGLNSPTGATLGVAQGTGTITNDDTPPTISIGNVSTTEGNSGTKAATFTVTLSAASGVAATVAYATANGTATAGSDYTAASGTLTFAPGVTTQTVSVSLLGDTQVEPDETFVVNLTNPTNATVAVAQATGTIVNDDAATTLRSLQFNGSNQRARFTTLPAMTVMTIEGWVKRSSDTGRYETFISNAASGYGQETFGLYVDGGNVDCGSTPPDQFAWAYTKTGGGWFTQCSGVTANLNAWHHIAVTRDASNTARIFVDGVLKGTMTNTAAPTSSTGALDVGDAGDAVTEFFPGLLDEVRVSNVARYTATFTPQTSSFAADANTLALFHFDEGSGQTLGDASGNSRNGVLGSSSSTETIDPTWSTDVPFAMPAVSIGNASVVEGNAGTITAVFPVMLSAAGGSTITVNYATANGTATAGTDFVAASGTVTFAPGVTSQTVAVAVNGDTQFEADETFVVNLSAPVNATLGVAQGIGTIVNDDALPSFSITGASVAEGNAGSRNLTFTVILSAASSTTASVAYATSDGTATAGTDYTATSGTLTFAPGVTSQVINVPVLGDSLSEPDETLVVTLSSPTGATISVAQATGTITNDDVPTLSINNVSIVEGNSGQTVATFTVTLSSAGATTATVDYATADGTATAGTDYTATSGRLTFPAGSTSQTIAVTVLGDSLYEANETFFVALTAPVNATIVASQGTGTIVNDDAPPAVTIGDVTATEGNTGTTAATFVLTLSPASVLPATVHYATSDGTAIAGSDYSAAAGTITFAPGVTSQTVTVPILGDTLYERDENFSVTLSSAVDAAIAVSSATATVVNDDAPPALSIGNIVVNEGNSGTRTANFTVTLSAVSGVPATVHYATADGTATAGSDYVAASGTLSFAPGVTSQTVAVAVLGDTQFEDDETFVLTLSAPSDASLAVAQGTATIVNDDLPALSIGNGTVVEGDSETSTITFTVTLSPASPLTTTVTYATADGTASAPIDYAAAAGTLTFAPGETSHSIDVTINGDTLYESDETFVLKLLSASNAVIAVAQGTGTIVNDDVAPTLSIGGASLVEGNAGTGTATFTVTLSAPSGVPASVRYATADGTATAGPDYTATTGTLTFAPGTTTQTIDVEVIGDTLFEADETFTVNLTAPTDATIVTAQGVGTIVNDDLPALSINSVSLTEGDAGTVMATFTVTLSPVSALTTTVHYATADGTATAPGDYTAWAGTLVIEPGLTSATVSVPVLGDRVYEPNETFVVNLSDPENAAIAVGQGVATIMNDDPAPTLAIDSVGVTEGNAGSSMAIFTVTLSPSSVAAATVHYATADGSATAGTDYLATSGTLTFAPGVTTQTIKVPVLGDSVLEADETFVVVLSGATDATISVSQGTGTILNDDLPALSISNATVVEGNAGSAIATFTVQLSAPNASTTTVSYATADGTAAAGSDYTAVSGTLTFAPGVTAHTIGVPVLGDTVYEGDETFFVNLSGAVNATIATSQATGTIVNDDALPVLAVSNAAVTEGNAGTATAVFSVTLSVPSPLPVTVHYATADGTASAGSDYTAVSGNLTFAPGITSQTIGVVVLGDTIFEADETFTVNLSAPAGATIGVGQGIGTILNDDAAAFSINSVSVPEGNAGSANATFTVTLSAPSAVAATVNYATANVTATAGVDYTAVAGTLTFAPGVTTQSIAVPVAGDALFESDETFVVMLSGATNAGIAVAQGVATIVNDDPAPTISVGNSTVTEGNAGSVNASFTITLSAPSGIAATVNYATANGTASAGADYIQTSGTLTFAPGVTSQTVPVQILGDTMYEPNETFVLNLSGATNATIGTSQGTGTITNDDAVPTLSAAGVSLNEGNSGTQNALVTVTLSAASGVTATVNFATANGTASSGSDYTATSGTLTFPPGVTTQTIAIPIAGDTLYETDETFVVNLSAPSGATIAVGQATVTIRNDDSVPTLTISSPSVAEPNSGTRTLSYVVSLSAASGRTVTVNYATADGTATAGSDYTAKSGTLTIAAGSTSGTISVSINGDTTPEANETVLVNLSSPTNATLAQSQGIGTITDNDGSVTVSSPSSSGLTWATGSAHAITWTASGFAAGATFRIELSRNGGTTYELVAAAAPTSTSTSGSYNWTVTGPATTQARIRVTWTGNSAVTDVGNNNFRIQ